MAAREAGSTTMHAPTCPSEEVGSDNMSAYTLLYVLKGLRAWSRHQGAHLPLRHRNPRMLAFAALVKCLIQGVETAANIQAMLAHQHPSFRQPSVKGAIAMKDTVKDHAPHC